jgi:hypothetical protein
MGVNDVSKEPMFKAISIKELRTTQDITDEYQTDVNILFVFRKPLILSIKNGEIEYNAVIDCVRLYNEWMAEELSLDYVSNTSTITGIPVSPEIIKACKERLKRSRDPKMKHYNFDENFDEMLEKWGSNE